MVGAIPGQNTIPYPPLIILCVQQGHQYDRNVKDINFISTDNRVDYDDLLFGILQFKKTITGS